MLEIYMIQHDMQGFNCKFGTPSHLRPGSTTISMVRGCLRGQWEHWLDDPNRLHQDPSEEKADESEAEKVGVLICASFQVVVL